MRVHHHYDSIQLDTNLSSHSAEQVSGGRNANARHTETTENPRRCCRVQLHVFRCQFGRTHGLSVELEWENEMQAWNIHQNCSSIFNARWINDVVLMTRVYHLANSIFIISVSLFQWTWKINRSKHQAIGGYKTEWVLISNETNLLKWLPIYSWVSSIHCRALNRSLRIYYRKYL